MGHVWLRRHLRADCDNGHVHDNELWGCGMWICGSGIIWQTQCNTGSSAVLLCPHPVSNIQAPENEPQDSDILTCGIWTCQQQGTHQIS